MMITNMTPTTRIRLPLMHWRLRVPLPLPLQPCPPRPKPAGSASANFLLPGPLPRHTPLTNPPLQRNTGPCNTPIFACWTNRTIQTLRRRFLPFKRWPCARPPALSWSFATTEAVTSRRIVATPRPSGAAATTAVLTTPAISGSKPSPSSPGHWCESSESPWFHFVAKTSTISNNTGPTPIALSPPSDTVISALFIIAIMTETESLLPDPILLLLLQRQLQTQTTATCC
mmetsp:Transcript_21321/g.50458  ORF Transcript_21321/g.50458 Transcript_21321/m.50458 type:complete len:229 (+) Transcript_21321:1141-1827(+)